MGGTPLKAIILTGALAATVVFLAAAMSGEPESDSQHYTNVAPQSHLRYRTNNDFRDRKYFVQPMCGGVAVLDFDQDGLQDIFLTNGANLPSGKKSDPSFYNCLLRNRGDGTFEDVTQKAGLEGAGTGYNFGAAAGDYDNDGRDDLFLTSAEGDVLYHNNGDGTFRDVTEGSGLDTKPPHTLSVSAAWFDYDNDGLLDLVVSEYTTWTPQTDVRCRAAHGPGDVYCFPKTYASVPNRLYHNLGHGKFQDVTESSGFSKSLGKGMGIAIADFNRDGLPDVFVANDTERNFLYLNRGNGNFEESGLLQGVAYNDEGSTVSGMGADAADYDNDGWPDVFYNDLNFQIFGLFHNDLGRSFAYASIPSGIERLSRNFSGWSNGFIDFDNDGWKDIYSANGDVDDVSANSKQHDTMWRNLNGRKFEDFSMRLGADFASAGYHRGSAFADLNNDGAMDIIVTALNEPPRILINSGNRNHWILLDMVGHRTNRDAIGASVKVVMESGRTLYNRVRTSVGFMGSSDRRVPFGLGNEAKIREVEVRWPSGVFQRIANPKADRILKIDEPAGG